MKTAKLLFLVGILTISSCVMTPVANLKPKVQPETNASAPGNQPPPVAVPSLSDTIQPPASQSDAF
ncbi:MAG: hypothetical protein WCR55_08000 [Lentisphaerota bacterium]